MRRLVQSIRSSLNEPVSVRRSIRDEPVRGKRILVTGASSGIGRATALRLAAAGARVAAAARREAELELLHEEVVAVGGELACRACDLSHPVEVESLIRWILGEYGGVDVLVNNAGHSVRRPIVDSFERLDDFPRAIAINYLAPVRLTMGLLPSMLERRRGHVVNIGTWTVPVGTSPRFAAYHSSKVALAGFGRCLEAELAASGVRVTAVHFPLVHTAMSSPTKAYAELPGLSAEQAAEWIVTAVRTRPLRIAPRYAFLLSAIGPRLADRILLRWG